MYQQQPGGHLNPRQFNNEAADASRTARQRVQYRPLAAIGDHAAERAFSYLRANAQAAKAPRSIHPRLRVGLPCRS